MLLLPHNSLEYYHKGALGLSQWQFFISAGKVGEIFNKNIFLILQWFIENSRLNLISAPPSPALSKSYQAVILKSGVIWVLPRGGAQLKLCLAQIRGHTETAGTSLWRIPSFSLLFFFSEGLWLCCYLSITLCFFLRFGPFHLSLSSFSFHFLVILIIQTVLCLAVTPFALSHLDEKAPAANWSIRPAPDDIIVTCMKGVLLQPSKATGSTSHIVIQNSLYLFIFSS